MISLISPVKWKEEDVKLGGCPIMNNQVYARPGQPTDKGDS